MKTLLIVYHSLTGKTHAMANAVAEGARHADIHGVSVCMLPALEAGPAELLRTDALIIGTPENFGTMSGGMKDFLDRTFYACEGRLQGLPVAVFIGAGNDGSGAVAALRRIFNGFGFREVRDPVVALGPLREEHVVACKELGMAMAAGVELGIF